MAQRRKSLSEDEVRTVLAVIQTIQQHTGYSYSKLNTFMGSVTIVEMEELQRKLKKWCFGEEEQEEY